jgi:hypothetical protein
LSEIKFRDEEKEILELMKEKFLLPESICKEVLEKSIKLAEKNGMRGVSNFGDLKITEEEAFAKKEQAGLSRQDFLVFWNRYWVLVAVEMEVANLIRFKSYNNTCQSGLSSKDATLETRKRFIYYGDPENSPPNFQGQDADIYPEFKIRYEKWRVQYSVQEEHEMMMKYSTCNAMVRDLISKGDL